MVRRIGPLVIRESETGTTVIEFRKDIEDYILRYTGVVVIGVRGGRPVRLKGGYRLRGLVLASREDAVSLVFGRTELLVARVHDR